MDLKLKLLEYYKAERQLEKDRKKLVNRKCDFRLMEKIVQACNENPNLKVTVRLMDGTKIDFVTKQEKPPLLFGDKLDGFSIEDIIEEV